MNHVSPQGALQPRVRGVFPAAGTPVSVGMSQELMDWTVAWDEAVMAVLALLSAECRLSDELSSVQNVTGAEMTTDQAAGKLARTTEALPSDRRPAGWTTPAVKRDEPRAARRRFVAAAIRCLAARYADEHAWADADSEYADELLCIAARDLAEGTVA